MKFFKESKAAMPDTRWAAPALILTLALFPGCKGDKTSGRPAGVVTPVPVPRPIPPAPPSPPAPGVPAGTNGIGSVLLSQGIQDPAWTTPLVAGRNATLRVFLAAPADNTLTPTVRVTLRNAAGAAVLDTTIPATLPFIPTNPLLGVFDGSWNLDIDGGLIQPGSSLLVQLVDDAQSVGLTQRVWPSSGVAKPLDVILPDAALRVTLVPITLTNVPGAAPVTGQVTTPTRTLDDWSRTLRQLYPLGSSAPALDIQVAQPWASNLELFASALNEDLETDMNIRIRNALERKRLATPGSAYRYYAGIFPLPPGGTLYGLGDFGKPGTNTAKSCMVLDAQPTYGTIGDPLFVLPHELGHCLGRRHSDCGGAMGPDPLAPANAYLGTWGLDIATHTVKDPQLNRDFMSYCPPLWTSQHTFEGLQRAIGLDQATFALHRSSTNALVVSGTVNADGSVALDPLMDVEDEPSQPEPGPYTLQLFDAAQNLLASVPFAVETPEEGPGDPSFFFEVDLTPDQEAALASAVVIPPTGPATLVAPSRSTTLVAREPVALAWKGGVHLGWDSVAHPEVMVRDPRSGEIIATARGGSMEVATDAQELELVMLDGLHTSRRRVLVRP